jgi:hypothetical protein
MSANGKFRISRLGLLATVCVVAALACPFIIHVEKLEGG